MTGKEETARSIKVVHVPYSKRNPYQKRLGDSLKKLGVKIEGVQGHNLCDISFINITLFDILIKYWRLHIIHLHWHHSLFLVKPSRFKTIIKSTISLLQLLFVRMAGVKLVWTVHNLTNHEDTHQNLEKIFTKILARLSDGIIVHCETAKKEICRALDIRKKEKICIIPHGNFIGCYENTISQEKARNQLNLSNSKITFLFLGEVRYYKGVLELIDAFKCLDCKSAQLIIAGKPYNKQISEEIQRMINGNKNIRTVLEFIYDNDLQKYINATDIMVFPYRHIFTSGGILLAMSFDKPIIAPRLGCITDTLDSLGSVLYDSSEKGGLLKAMEKAISSKDEIRKMGNHNLELAKRADWKVIAEITSDIYRKVISK